MTPATAKPRRRRKRGVKGKVWFRQTTGQWCVRIKGTHYELGTNKEKAQADANRLMEESRDLIPGDHLTVAVLAELYLENQKKKRRQSTVVHTERILNDFVLHYGKCRVSDLTGNEIDKWLEHHDDWAASTKYNRAVIIGGIFNFAMRKKNRWISRNPFQGQCEDMEKPGRRDAIFEPQQIEDVLKLADKRFGDFFKALLGTGCRAYSEMAVLTAKQIEEVNGHLLIRLKHHKTSSKKAKERLIDINDSLEPMFRELMAKYKTGPLFRNRAGNAWTGSDASQRFRRWRRTGKLKWLNEHHNLHACRHTFATMLLRKGVPIWRVASILGNSVQTVEKHYAHALHDDREACRAAANVMSF